MARNRRNRSDTRPASIQHLKKLVDGPQRQSLRYSLLPAPQMTELEFWAALVQDYRQTVERLPTLTSNKLRGGVPPPLRGVVWPSIAGAHDSHLHAEFERLSEEPSPYDGLIGKDVGRSFPNVEMFREKDGEGQNMLRRVLKAFSLYDDAIGYCQGLGFVVGPLLMHMNESEAFCILVRLMERYDLRSCYLPDLSGLHLRIYQFQQLLTQHLPELATRLEGLKIEPLYVSQWFLSFFAVTCPLPMLLRIYDVILSEGATETLMRVALSLMRRNERKLLAFTEFEDAMQFLLSRSLWDTYAQQADDLVSDFTSLTCFVSPESLQSLEAGYRQSQSLAPPSMLKSAATSLLGRFWAGASHASSKSATLSLSIPRGRSMSLRKSSSGNSLTSTIHSVGTHVSEVSTVATDISEEATTKVEVTTVTLEPQMPSNAQTSDREFHHQIEELLTAMNHLQRQQVELGKELQKEKEERAEDRKLSGELLQHLRKQNETVTELLGEEEELSEADMTMSDLIDRAETRFVTSQSQRLSILQSKHQLRDTAEEWRIKHDAESARCQELNRRLDEREIEQAALKESLREARQRAQDTYRDKQRLERTVQDLRNRQSFTPDSPQDTYTPITPAADPFDLKMPAPKAGLREFKLGKSETTPRTSSLNNAAFFSKRSSSLNTQAVTANDIHQPAQQDALLLELVNSKTAEAVARQELEETRGKLDALRKILSGPTTSPMTRVTSGSSPSAGSPGSEIPSLAATPKDITKAVHAPSASTGGFFSGWGRKS